MGSGRRGKRIPGAHSGPGVLIARSKLGVLRFTGTPLLPVLVWLLYTNRFRQAKLSACERVMLRVCFCRRTGLQGRSLRRT